MTTIGKKISGIRKQKGLTQEELSDLSKINLRTLQRIEKDETEPRGNTLSGICTALGINIEDILDYGKIEDKSYIMYLHLSVLGGVLIPFGNIILPLILWLNKRDRIVEVHNQGSNILNFQIVWAIVTNIVFGIYVTSKILKGEFYNGFAYATIVLYAINFFYPIYVAIRIKTGTLKNFYWAPIRFVR
ncbi:helix-turn-helix domain-containing protein [Flavobacterium zepuense]|uniref:Helix-turn-helix domain-containing protein n=1 Tax=Flavobacterium zepuense TaxID=2593302 RepID=A0A552UVE5_9FLAO|nr:helix-turn-helix domain-containing protein [Flavobacterium zepuense]TRW22165.1 helix-turn-helix domain-containing protein [Flavobacterium zepuense]